MVAAIVLGVLIGALGSATIGAAVAVAGIALTLLIGFVRRVATTYTVTDERLIIERGLLSKHMQQTRIDRVQNVNTNQTVLERALKVGVVDFDTAGSGDSDFQFIGVADPRGMVTVVDRAQRARQQEDRSGDAGVGGL